QPAGTDVTAHWATAPGSATAGPDYTSASGTVTIVAGKSTASVSVNVVGDAAVEPDETFNVTLSSPVGATLSRASGTATILDDDTLVRATGTGTILDDDPPGIVIGIGDASVSEGNTGVRTVTLLVTMSQPSATNTTVHWATGAATATASDFTAASKDLVIPAG